MKKSLILSLLGVILFACDPGLNVPDPSVAGEGIGENCGINEDFTAPALFELVSQNLISFEGSFRSWQFLDDQTGFLFGSKQPGGYAGVLKTKDGGMTWESLPLEANYSPISMYFVDANRGFVTVQNTDGCPPPNCQNKTTLYETQDGGQTWEERTYPDLKGVLYEIQFDEAGNGFALLFLDSNVRLLRTTDFAQTWEVLVEEGDIRLPNIKGGMVLENGRIWVHGAQGELLQYDTDGNLQQRLNMPMQNFYQLKVIDEEKLVATGVFGAIRSLDGGQNWEMIYEEYAELIGANSEDELWLIANQTFCLSDIYRSQDAFAYSQDLGTNWTFGELGTNLGIGFVDAYQQENGNYLVLLDQEIFVIKPQ
ncbi:MAG: hypothetical protein AAFP89_22465 [Bacteroidota bacterium]